MSTLIKESIHDFEMLIEKVGAMNNYYIHGIMMQSEKENRNGRTYQRKEFEKEVARYNEQIIPARRGVGELEHSESYMPDMTRVSHIFEESLKMQGNDVYGKARVLQDTVYGQTLAAFIKEKIPFGLSSKGTGSVLKTEGKMLVHEYNLITPGDAVWFQSCTDAKANTLAESALIEMMMENDRNILSIYNTELIESVKKNVRTATKEQIAETIRQEFKRVLDIL